MNRLSPILFAAALLAPAGLALAAPPEPGPDAPQRDQPRLEQARQQFQEMRAKVEQLQQEVRRLRAQLDDRRAQQGPGPQAGPPQGARGPARQLQVERRARLRSDAGPQGLRLGPPEGRGPQDGPAMDERAQHMRQMGLKLRECCQCAGQALREGRFEEAAKCAKQAAELKGKMARMREEWAGQGGADRPRGPAMRGPDGRGGPGMRGPAMRGPEGRGGPGMRGQGPRGPEGRAPGMRAGGGDVQDRLARLEQRMERIENVLRKLVESRRTDRD